MNECESFIHDRGEVPFPGVFFSKYPRGKTGAIQLVSSQANAIGRSRTGSGQPGWYPGELRQHHATPSEFFAPRFRQVRPPQRPTLLATTHRDHLEPGSGKSPPSALTGKTRIIFQAYQRTSTMYEMEQQQRRRETSSDSTLGAGQKRVKWSLPGEVGRLSRLHIYLPTGRPHTVM